ncbi:MAG: nitroreductase family protein [Hyphomicrobiales bacterium]
MTPPVSPKLHAALNERFSDAPEPPSNLEYLLSIAARGSCRNFTDDPIDRALLDALIATAFSAPTKSDLQQRDIVIITDPQKRKALDEACDTQGWVSGAPLLLVILGNHRRQQKIHERQGHPFANNHIDALFNAAVDGGILLSSLVTCFEFAGLGCCPISAIRNKPDIVADILNLPKQVFPVSALAVGWPQSPPTPSPRLPLSVTVHENSFDDTKEAALVQEYDSTRTYENQRFSEKDGISSDYGWSEDKARQYARIERGNFGKWLEINGFKLI